MNKFIKKILVFTLAFFLIEKIFYLFILVSPSVETDSRLEKVIKGEMNKDIIVLGSSRGARDIIVAQIEDSLGLSAYNLSYPGSDIDFHEFVLRSLLQFNYKPKIVLLAVDEPSELLPSESIKFRLERLYPLVKYNYINNEMIERKEHSFLSKFLVLSRINISNFYILPKHYSDIDTISKCGSMPISFQRKNRAFKYQNAVETYPLNEELPSKIESFLKFQELCISNHIKLYLVFSPNFKTYNYSFEKRLRQLAKPSVPFLVYDTLKNEYRDKSFYYDESHLQTKGAVLFTSEIISAMQKNKRHK